MTNPDVHISCYFGQPNYSSPGYKEPHFAVDIQTPLGTPVTTPETVTLAFNDAQNSMNTKRGLTDVLLFSKESGLAYWIVHLDINNLPPEIAKRHWLDKDSNDLFQRGVPVGQVGGFFQ